MGFPKGASIPFGEDGVKTPPAKRFRLFGVASQVGFELRIKSRLRLTAALLTRTL
jgi:hypothetical protein